MDDQAALTVFVVGVTLNEHWASKPQHIRKAEKPGSTKKSSAWERENPVRDLCKGTLLRKDGKISCKSYIYISFARASKYSEGM